ncbi:MAG: HD domain-containing protein [Anaerolineaceae bacterium]|nr:HD domain-containing protein [Anaerolineaceae bacterium]
MEINTPVIISFLAFLFYTILLTIILTREVRSRLYITFSLYLVTMIIWSFGSLMIFLNPPIGTTYLWASIMVLGPIAMPVAISAFIAVFLMQDWKPLMVFGLATLGIAIIADLKGLIFPQASFQNERFSFEYGWPAVIIPAVIWVTMIGYSTIKLVLEYRQSKDLIHRNRIKHLLLVIGVIFLGALTNVTPLKNQPFDIAFNVVTALLITNAILRHQLLDINIVIRKGLLYSIPTVIIGSSYFLILSLFLRVFRDVSETQLILTSLAVAILVTLVAQPLRNRAQAWIDRLFFREKYDSSLMLQRISVTAASELDLVRLTQMILDEVMGTLHINQAAFFLKQAQTGDFFLAAQRGMDSSVHIVLERTHPLVRHLASNPGGLSSDDIGVLPQFKSLWGQEKDDLIQIGAKLFIPLKAKNELVGILAVGAKRSELSYSQDDRLTLTTLANQTAVAIENARLFFAEQFRREELDALYSLTRQLVATDNVGDVLESTTRHVVESTHATFSRVVTQDENGAFICRAAYPTTFFELISTAPKQIAAAADHFFIQALTQGIPISLDRSTQNMSADELKALQLDRVSNLIIFPLKVGDTPIGLLVIGEETKSPREFFTAEKIRLVSAIAGQAASALQRANLHEQMEDSFVQTVLALATAADARDTYTNDHSVRMASMADATCRELGLSDNEVSAIHWATLLHDIGKIGIPDEILRKPGPLDTTEWAVMRRHPDIGARIVAPVKKLANVSPIIRAHHEQFNGSGYPMGLQGEEIPLGARVVAVVDTYSAMTDDRVYRKPFTHAEAVSELHACSGTQFDPQVVEAFLRVLDRGAVPKNQPIILSIGNKLTDHNRKSIDGSTQSDSVTRPAHPKRG